MHLSCDKKHCVSSVLEKIAVVKKSPLSSKRCYSGQTGVALTTLYESTELQYRRKLQDVIGLTLGALPVHRYF